MKKVRFYQTWQFNMWVIITLIVLSFSAPVFYHPLMKYIKHSKFDASIQGTLINYEAKQTLYQGYEKGTQIITRHYIVYYRYEVDGKHYQAKELLSGQSAVGFALKYISNSPNKTIKVKYQQNDPAQSVVDL